MLLSAAFRGASRASSRFSPRLATSSLPSRSIVTLRFTKDHELLKYDDETKIGTISVTDYAQKSLGDVVFVELPAKGTSVAQGDQIGAVESVKAASDIYSPVSGDVVEVNETLNDQPGLINKSPEDKAWLCKIAITKPNEVDELMNAEQYKAHCEEH
ncbi:hypothetical protein SCHPADRAFT_992297 [Schizopora paradoxa]|uniref:Glycine cleavage system H protein n=1 Tax=Schizopora paradoxa TaxID=27342 RepID=A0A0H2SSV4_9AGAM|nr:hypothetical protein SCHPADRAFT_992297 [Schizopora paradoxa]